LINVISSCSSISISPRDRRVFFTQAQAKTTNALPHYLHGPQVV
jgi:hypothetical protein